MLPVPRAVLPHFLENKYSLLHPDGMEGKKNASVHTPWNISIFRLSGSTLPRVTVNSGYRVIIPL